MSKTQKTLSIDTDALKKLEEIAEEEERSLSQTVSMILEAALSNLPLINDDHPVLNLCTYLRIEESD